MKPFFLFLVFHLFAKCMLPLNSIYILNMSFIPNLIEILKTVFVLCLFKPSRSSLLLNYNYLLIKIDEQLN